jgi:TolB protein
MTLKAWLVTVAAPLAAAAMLAPGADAAFHGKNGRIAVVSNRDGNSEIYTMDPDGTGRVNLTQSPAEDGQPRFSIDGSQIVFSSNRGGDYAIYTMASDGSNVQLVTAAEPNEHRPSFTADGHIVFQSGFFPNRIIWIVGADGSGLTRLTPLDTDNANPAPAPGGNAIAFTKLLGDRQALFTMTQSGGNVQQVTSPGSNVGDYQSNWSPTGADLVFIRNDTNGVTHVFTVHANGNGLRQVTNVPNRVESEPTWSPDGKTIAFHGCTNPNSDSQRCVIYTVNSDGSGETDISTPHAPFLETFSNSTRDPVWHTIQTGTDTTLAQQNGRLEITLGADAVPGGPFNVIDAHYGFNCSLPGDFDVQTDYSLLEWPPANGAFAELAGFFAGTGIFRQSSAFGEFYNANSGPAFSTFPTTDLTGSMRLVRTGGQLHAYFLDTLFGVWVQVLSAPAAPDAVTAGLSLQGGPDWAHQEVKAAFDNFRINSGSLACPSWWDDGSPDWQAN